MRLRNIIVFFIKKKNTSLFHSLGLGQSCPSQYGVFVDPSQQQYFTKSSAIPPFFYGLHMLFTFHTWSGCICGLKISPQLISITANAIIAIHDWLQNISGKYFRQVAMYNIILCIVVLIKLSGFILWWQAAGCTWTYTAIRHYCVLHEACLKPFSYEVPSQQNAASEVHCIFSIYI